MVEDLALITGSDIPFPEGQLVIHQPTINEIGYVGSNIFFMGCELLNFSKDIFLKDEKDKIDLANRTNFEVFMSIMIQQNAPEIQKSKEGVFYVLTLMFPDYELGFDNIGISLTHKQTQEKFHIDNNNFEQFKIVLSEMFCLKETTQGGDLNPKGQLAAKIANKIKKGREKVAKEKGETSKTSILNRYLSILAIGLSLDLSVLKEYTIYQLFDQFTRFQMKLTYDAYFRAKLAGAQDLEPVEQWMEDIH